MRGGLDEVVKRFVASTPHEEIVPKRPRVRKPPQKQLNLFDFHGNPMPQSQMGLFYELVGYGLYGGELYGSRRTPKPGYPTFESNPDTVDLFGKEMREYKACSVKRTLILRDGQIEGYSQDQVAYPDWNIRPVLFRHGLQDIRSFTGTERQLFGKLANLTLYGLDLPLPILAELHNGPRHNNGIVVATRSETESFPPATRVSKGFLNEFFFDPVNGLRHLGIDEAAYAVKRFVSPSQFRVAGNNVVPFPILRIDPVDLESSRKYFIASHSGPRRPVKYAPAPLYDIPV